MTKTRILVVDDEEDFTKMMKFNLEATGDYEVECESISSHVIPSALSFDPDLVLLDVVMPGMDGGSVKHQFETHPQLRHVPIIFVTALVSHSDVKSGVVVESGGQVMLAKPVELSNLLLAVEKKLSGDL